MKKEKVDLGDVIPTKMISLRGKSTNWDFVLFLVRVIFE